MARVRLAFNYAISHVYLNVRLHSKDSEGGSVASGHLLITYRMAVIDVYI